MPRKRRPIEDRLWDRVPNREPGQCWLWNGRSGPDHYPRISVGGRDGVDLAHRVVFKIIHGEIPAGSVIRHKCDNKRCVNPDHLECGSQLENVADCINRDRLARLPLQVRQQIAALKANGTTYYRISKLLGVPLSVARYWSVPAMRRRNKTIQAGLV
jgi:hypothetical protein